jgi:hypothetical protein
MMYLNSRQAINKYGMVPDVVLGSQIFDQFLQGYRMSVILHGFHEDFPSEHPLQHPQAMVVRAHTTARG